MSAPWPHGWTAGMVDTKGERYEDGDGPWQIGHYPDLDDDGTVGHLKGMVREKAGDPHIIAEYISHALGGGGYWLVRLPGVSDLKCPTGATEGEAYKAALDHLAAKP